LSSAISVLVISGPSGAGKSTMLARVLAETPGVRFSVSHTTRPPRPGEAEGVDYYFVSDQRFSELRERREFIEWAQVHGHLYGTSVAEFEKARREGIDLILDLDVQGAAQVRLNLPDPVTVFVLPPSYKALERRLRARGPDESFAQRLAAATEELSLYATYDYLVVNDDLDRGVEDLKAIIRAARCRTSRAGGSASDILNTFPNRKEA
jgi:guanylate kinase